jgi:hypothetical protein
MQSLPVINNCSFSGNMATEDGGSMYNYSHSSPTVTNCTLTGNRAANGGGIYNNEYSSPLVTNCILSANHASVLGDEVYNISSSDPNFANCNIAGSGGSLAWNGSLGIDGGGNIEVVPFFVAPGYWDPNGTSENLEDDFWVEGDYRLRENSLCIDAGNPSTLDEPDATDLAGFDRFVDGNCDGAATVDMGAYEYNRLSLGDFDGYGCDVDLADFAVLAKNWLHETSTIDIAPVGNPDGIINLNELLILIDNWLMVHSDAF